jgi:hypothetical protein
VCELDGVGNCSDLCGKAGDVGGDCDVRNTGLYMIDVYGGKRLSDSEAV